MSTTNAFSSSTLISFAQDVNYTKTEGFKQYKTIFNQKNAWAARNNPQGAYLMVEDTYNVSGPLCHLVCSLQTECYSIEDTLYQNLMPEGKLYPSL